MYWQGLLNSFWKWSGSFHFFYTHSSYGRTDLTPQFLLSVPLNFCIEGIFYVMLASLPKYSDRLSQRFPYWREWGYCKGICGYKIDCPNICINAGWRKWSMREKNVWYTLVILYFNYLVDKKSKVPWSHSNPVTGVAKSCQGTFSVSVYLLFLNS